MVAFSLTIEVVKKYFKCMVLYVRFEISLPLFGKPAGDVKKDDWFWMLYTDSQDESRLVYQTFSVFSEGLLH
jgi:hypothetical protein